MSDFDINPFSDPSVRQVARPPPPRQTNAVLDDYNPFNETTAPARQQPAAGGKTPSSNQPAVMPVAEAPPPYTPSSAAAAQASAAAEDLRRRQVELEAKEAELARKEQEMQRAMQGQIRQNNFPPLPAVCCVQPCFYQDFNVDIPLEFQRIVKTGYYIWMAYCGLLVINMFGAMGYFIGTVSSGATNQSGVTFGLSILYLLLFTPCSFVCWYRPLYKAFRSDSSFNFFLFFFIFFFQFCVTVLQAIGIDGWGFCGWITGAQAMASQLPVAVYVIIFIVASFFTALAVVFFICLIRVHRIYRNTGASFAKAQEEFARGVWSNQTVRQTTANIASTAARGAAENAMSGTRY